MARKIELEIVADASSLERSLQRAARSTKKFNQDISKASRGALAGSGAFKSLGRSVAFASTAFLGTAGFTAAVKSSVNAASDLHEEISKTNVVFGQSASSIQAWANTTSNAFGLSRRQALATASSFGALFKPIGIIGPAAAAQSRQLTQLGADLASFYNTNVQDALDAIKSGLVGESEPLRRYGVLLSETRVQQEAMSETGKKNAKSLTLQEKALARITLIFKDSQVAQGDFARTSSGLANQQRILTANIDNLQAAIGTALLPMINNTVKSLNTWLSSSENQKRVVDDVKEAAGLLATVLRDLKAVFDTVNTITGSTTTTLKLLFGAFLAFKTAKFATMFYEIATAETAVGVAAGGAAAKATLLVGALDLMAGPVGLIAAAGAAFLYMEQSAIKAADAVGKIQAQTFEKGSGLETTLVPRLAKQIAALKAAGKTSAQILATLRKQLGGSLKADDLISEAFAFGSGSDPTLTARIRNQVAARAAVAGGTKAAGAGAKGTTPRSPLQGRFNIQELKLAQAQLTASLADDRRILIVEKAITEQQIAQAKTLKDRTALTQQLGGIVGQIRDIDKQGADAIKQQAQARKDAAKVAAEAAQARKAARMQTTLDWLDFGLEKAQATKGIKDNIAAEKKIIAYWKQRIKTEGRKLELVRSLWEAQQALKDFLSQKNASPADKPLAAVFKPGTWGTGSNPFGNGGGVSSSVFAASLPPSPGQFTGAGARPAYQINNLNLYGVQDISQLENELIKRAGTRPQARRGG